LRDYFAITTYPILLVFVYSRMDRQSPRAPISTFECAISANPCRAIRPLTICLFLDGENAWEYYPGNGRALPPRILTDASRVTRISVR